MQGVGRVRFKLEALTEQQLQEVHVATLELLAEYGIAIHHVPSRKLLEQHGAVINGEIVKIPAELVEMARAKAPASFAVIGRNPERTIRIGAENEPVLGPAAGTVYVMDLERGRRAARLEDLRNFLSLSQSSEYVGVACAGMLEPSDLPPQGKHLVQMQETITFSDKPIIGLAMGKNVSEDSITMAHIATQGAAEHYILGIVNTLSPMAWDERMLEAIWAYALKQQPLVITCCSMAGFTSPTTLTATLVQNNAEVLAGIVLAQLISPGTPVVYGNTSTITDMLSMNLCIGAPEYALLSTAFAQLARYYGLPFRSGGGLTDAKELDAQAGIEAATNLFFTLANNADFVLHTMGVMESFLSISYEKWIMDEEICGRILRMRKGLGGLPAQAVDMIGRVGPSGHFLDQPDTLLNFKGHFFRPSVSDRSNWDGWVAKKKNFQQTAREIWRQRLKNYIQPELPAKVESELKKYIESKLG